MKIFAICSLVILLFGANIAWSDQNSTADTVKYKIANPSSLSFTGDDEDEDSQEMETNFNLVKNLSFSQKEVDLYLSLLSEFNLENMTIDLDLSYRNRETAIKELSSQLASRPQELLTSLVLNGFQEIYDYRRGYYEPMTEAELNSFLSGLNKEQLINLIVVLETGEWSNAMLDAMRQTLSQADSGKLRALAISWGYLVPPKIKK